MISSTSTPPTAVEYKAKRLSSEQRAALGSDLMNMVDQAISDRQSLDINLDQALDAYEMRRPQPQNSPWPNSSNVAVPETTTQLDTMASQLFAQVFVQRLFVVNGLNEDAQAHAHEVERYYNGEYLRNNDAEAYWNYIFGALLYGTSAMEILWRRTVTRRTIQRSVAEKDSLGADVRDPLTGKTRLRLVTEEVDVLEYDNYELTPLTMRDFVLGPVYSKGINKAAMYARKLWLMEDDLHTMVAAGDMWKEAVDEVLSSLAPGSSEITEDRMGTRQLEAGGQLEVSSDQGSTGGVALRRMRGPFLFWRVHTDAYDLNDDGFGDEGVYFIHQKTQRCTGYDTYKYFIGKRPAVLLAPWPRLETYPGYGVPERLRTIQAEMDNNENQRINYIDLHLNPPRKVRDGTKAASDPTPWGLNRKFPVDQMDDIEFVTMPALDPAVFLESQALESYAARLTGLYPTMGGGAPSTRRTAREISAGQQGAGVRLNFMAARVRQSLAQIFDFIHHLKLQYAEDTLPTTALGENGMPTKTTIPKEILGLDYELSIANLQSPIDRDPNRMLFIYSLLMKNPIVMADPVKMYRVTRMMLEEFNRSDTLQLIGTEQDVVAMAQQAKEQQAQAAAAGGQPGGQPGGGGAKGGGGGGGEQQNGQAAAAAMQGALGG